MNSLKQLACLLLISAPLAFAQGPDQPPMPGGGPMPDPHGMHDRGPSRDFDGPRDRMHDGGPGGFGGMRVPPGTWWRNPDVVSRISLSSDQVKKIDGIFLDSRVQLIHMHASLEEEELRLEPLLSANPVNEQAALAQISKIADTRADLEKANAKMLLSIRGVLTSDQWTKLQQHPMERHDFDRGGSGNGARGPHRGSQSTPPTPPPAGE